MVLFHLILIFTETLQFNFLCKPSLMTIFTRRCILSLDFAIGVDSEKTLVKILNLFGFGWRSSV